MIVPSSRFAISTSRAANELLTRIQIATHASYFSQEAPMRDILESVSQDWSTFVADAKAKGVVLGGDGAHPKVAAAVQAVQTALSGLEDQIACRFKTVVTG